jgi:hypothetical protein
MSGVAPAVAGLALVLAIVLWETLGGYARKGGELPRGSALDATDLSYSATVARQVGTRPYLDSPLPIQDIIDAAEPVPDPQGGLDTVRWEVPGSLNGFPGTWELVVNRAEKVIYHVSFVR